MVLMFIVGCSKDDPPTASTNSGSSQGYALHQNYPNPFNGTTSVGFEILENALVTFRVYSTNGQEVATLLEHEMMDRGVNEVEFDASNLASGVYVYTLVVELLSPEGRPTSSVFKASRKMMLLK